MIELNIGSTSKRSRFTPKPVSIDFDALPEASRAFVIAYGLRQYLQDAQAGAETEAEAHANVDARVTKLKSGDLTRTRGEGLSKPDTVESRAIKLAKDFLRNALKEAKATATKKQVAEAASELIKTDSTFMKEAKKQLDAETGLKGESNEAKSSVLDSILAKAKTAAPAVTTE